ncbi:Uncharacterised 5xTM membrane BCR, YitT family COG1284 [Pseudarthrobacter chlorophenolicus]|nr:Uncharacterised 5xTM membrane BCR, YitT family COG1284 [Pseudarthrobacter chlorophenolicus]
MMQTSEPGCRHEHAHAGTVVLRRRGAGGHAHRGRRQASRVRIRHQPPDQQARNFARHAAVPPACPVNLPFFGLAIWKKGWNFALRTGAAIALVSVMASLHPWAFGSLELDPAYGVAAGNLLAGVGLLILFRHQSSLGGFNILALLLQDKLKWRAGYVQMVLDVAIVLAALAVVSPLMVLLSAAGATLLNLILALNHRPGRYLGK